MNIHEHQAKEILRNFGASTPNGIVIYNPDEIIEKIKSLNSLKYIVKAQIHAGGRGKAGGIELADKNNLINKVKKMFGKVLVTHQTGKEGKIVKRIYIEEVHDIKKEFYLSCLIDRSKSKIAFISSASGGMDIEEIAKNSPEKISTVKMDLSNLVKSEDIKKIINPFNLNEELKKKLLNLFK